MTMAVLTTLNSQKKLEHYKLIFKSENRDDNGCSYNFKLTKTTKQAHVVEHCEPLYCATMYGHNSQFVYLKHFMLFDIIN